MLGFVKYNLLKYGALEGENLARQSLYMAAEGK